MKGITVLPLPLRTQMGNGHNQITLGWVPTAWHNVRAQKIEGPELSVKDKRSDFWEWTRLERYPRYTKAPWLGAFTGFVIVLIAILVVLSGLATLFLFLFMLSSGGANHEAIRNIGLILIAVLGAPFVVWRATVAQKQADTAEQSHITDQINKAVAGLGAEKTVNRIGRPVRIYTGKSRTRPYMVEEPDEFSPPPRSKELRRYSDTIIIPGTTDEVYDGLHAEIQTWEEEKTAIEWQRISLSIGDSEAIAEVGNWSVFSESVPNIEVRIGAVYALERISQDSIRDHVQVMEILTAYIRENAPVSNIDPSEEPFTTARPRTDIQVALDVIGRRPPELIALEHSQKYRLDLRNVDLSGVNFSRGNFEGALFSGSRFEATNFRFANLRGVRFNDCLLNFVDFYKANLCGAIMDRAKLNRRGIGHSITFTKNIRGLSLAGADISAITFLPKSEFHSPTFGTKDTKLDYYLDQKREELAIDMEQVVHDMDGVGSDHDNAARNRLKEAGLLYWSPYDSKDGFSYRLRTKLWTDIGLKGFPYDDD